VHGILKAHSVKRLVAMLHRLMEAGLARQRDPDGIKFRPVIELTAAGVAVMKGEQPPPHNLADLMPRRAESRSNYKVTRLDEEVASPLSGDEADRFEKLRSLRSQLAREKQLPPYCVCHDSTLKQIARQAPGDLQSLERIKGMGPHKIKMYGDKILRALSPGERTIVPAEDEMPF
jgi:ATP-dependent DNA helicase RecQ